MAKSCFCTHRYPCQGSEQVELVPFGAIGPFLGVSLCAQSGQKEKPGSGPAPSIRPREGIEISLADPNRSTMKGTRGRGWGAAARAPRVSPFPAVPSRRRFGSGKPQLKIIKGTKPELGDFPVSPRAVSGRSRSETGTEIAARGRAGAQRQRERARPRRRLREGFWGGSPGPRAPPGETKPPGAGCSPGTKPGASSPASRPHPGPPGKRNPGGKQPGGGAGGRNWAAPGARQASCQKSSVPVLRSKGQPRQSRTWPPPPPQLVLGAKNQPGGEFDAIQGRDAHGERSLAVPPPLPRSVASHTPLLLPARCCPTRLALVRSQTLTSCAGRHMQAPIQLVFLHNAMEKLCWECTRG